MAYAAQSFAPGWDRRGSLNQRPVRPQAAVAARVSGIFLGRQHWATETTETRPPISPTCIWPILFGQDQLPREGELPSSYRLSASVTVGGVLLLLLKERLSKID
jgi:hypothetical protein